ncbi:MAG: UDP-N-acetylmuramoyl-L-alanyl-D-glutamate--2,6-diaminopimelate ligase [Actinomycetes bacterium]
MSVVASSLRPTTSGVLLSEVARAVSGDRRGADVQVSGITHDSRAIHDADVYVAFAGARFHGSEFIEQAMANGAVAVLTDEIGAAVADAVGLPCVVVPDVRQVLGTASSTIYGNPAESMTMVGITGTNGKTTTAYLLDAALRAAGRTTGLIGTITTTIDGESVASIRTTPEATDLFALLAVMKERGVDAVVMEVSSHALAMGRVNGITFDSMGFTHLSQDHLDFHHTMEEYLAAKALAFTPAHSRHGVVMVLNDESQAWSRSLIAQAQVPLTIVSAQELSIDAADVTFTVGSGAQQSATLTSPTTAIEVSTQMAGSWNVLNAVLAEQLAISIGVSADLAATGIASLASVPGRLESVQVEGNAIEGFVDYAHTPDAVAQVLSQLRSLTGTQRKLVVVIGCGGDRDALKRPVMGAAAARWADVVVITDDNPRSEDPAVIRTAVMMGAASANASASLVNVADRQAAIQQAVDLAGPDGLVAVLGKGHETGQEVAGVVTPFDDRVALRRALGGAQ